MIKYRSLKPYKYQLVEEYMVKTAIKMKDQDGGMFCYLRPVATGSMLVMKQGYSWDGTSGPTVDTENTMRAGLVHDSLYQLLREGVIGQEYVDYADELFHKILREDGVSRFRAWYYFKGVSNWFAHRFAKPDIEGVD